MEDEEKMTDVSLGEQESVPHEREVEKTKRTESRNRWLLVFFTALYCTFLAGAFFGYGPMQLMLEEHGAFDYQCGEGEEAPCPAQTSRLLQVHFIAQLTLMFSPIAGVIADRYSATTLMYLTATFGVLGLALLAIATGLRVDYLIFGSDVLLGLVSTCSSVMLVQTGLIFTTVTRQRIISGLNALYDAGALTNLALWAIENALECGITAIVAGYLGFAIFCFGGAIYYWRHVVPVQEDDTVNTRELQREDSLQAVSDRDDEFPTEGVDNSNSLEVDTSTQDADTVKASILEEEESCRSQDDGSDAAQDSSNDDYVLIANRTPSQQLKTKLYVLLCIFFAIHGTKNNFTLTTARDFLGYLGDDETGNKYLTIFTLMTPVSILGLPFMDFILNHYGYHAGFQSINVLSLAHGITMVSSDNLNVQILGFFIFSFFRCFLFTVTFSFIPTFMGQSAVGRGSGIITFWFGLLSFVNIGLSNWAVNGLGGNFFWPNLILTIAVVPCIFLAWLMRKCIQQESEAKSN